MGRISFFGEYALILWLEGTADVGVFHGLGRGMTRLAKYLPLFPLLLAAVGLSGCDNSWTWNQKLTVTVLTPDGLVAGSSVMQARMTDTHGAFVPAEAVGVSFSLRGEAVVVELPNGRYLFALLKDVPSASWLLYPKMRAEEAGELIERADGNSSRQLELSRDQYPLFVTFDDINDPASVKWVDPDNLGAVFGPGYRFDSITLTVTKEPMTQGKVKPLLRWLSQYYNRHLDGRRIETVSSKNRFANSLASGDFDTEKH